MVLVDYIGIFFTFPNTVDRCQTIFMISVNFIKKISKTTIIIDGPSCLNIRPTSPRLRADLFPLTGRLVSVRVVRGPSCLVPDLHIAAIGKRRTMIILAKLYRFYYYHYLFLVKMMIKYIILLYVAFKTT
jgi:hypothetical protein